MEGNDQIGNQEMSCETKTSKDLKLKFTILMSCETLRIMYFEYEILLHPTQPSYRQWCSFWNQLSMVKIT